jgi:hypothetical protein
MHHQLHIVGTSHHYQFGAGASYGPHECSANDHAAFAGLLRKVAESSAADAIAEELNEQALREVGSNASVPQLLARELKIPHLFCEPDREERQSLGIQDENSIRISAFPKTLDEKLVQRLVEQSWKRREEEWLRRLDGLASYRIVFVCGASHVETFVPRAIEHGFHVEVRHADWKA